MTEYANLRGRKIPCVAGIGVAGRVRRGYRVRGAGHSEPRCTCVALVDTSGSMGGEPIAKMNEALPVFASEIKQDSLTARRVDAAVIAFIHEVQLVTDFTSGLDFTPPPPLRAYGGTRIAVAGLDGLDGARRARKCTAPTISHTSGRF